MADPKVGIPDDTFRFSEAWLTPRKREILAWCAANRVSFRSLDKENPSDIGSFRVNIPLDVGRRDGSGATADMDLPVFKFLLELFDHRYHLEYLESYPWGEDKYRFVPPKTRRLI